MTFQEIIDLMNYRHYYKENSAPIFNKIQKEIIQMATKLSFEKQEQIAQNLVTHPAMVESDDLDLVKGIEKEAQVLVQQKKDQKVSEQIVSLEEYNTLKKIQEEMSLKDPNIENPMLFSSVLEPQEEKARRIA